MKPILCILVVASVSVWAGQAGDRAGIEKTITALEQSMDSGAKVPTELFTTGADLEDVDQLFSLHQRLAEVAKGPWSEVSAPHIVIKTIRLITPDVATVRATDTQVGSMAARRIPILFVMKKEGSDWLIASLEVLSGYLR